MIFVISRFGIEGWVWVLIASVPDLCIFLTFATVREKSLEYEIFSTSENLNLCQGNLRKRIEVSEKSGNLSCFKKINC